MCSFPFDVYFKYLSYEWVGSQIRGELKKKTATFLASNHIRMARKRLDDLFLHYLTVFFFHASHSFFRGNEKFYFIVNVQELEGEQPEINRK